MKPDVSISLRLIAFFSIIILATSCKKNDDKPTIQPPVKVTVMEISAGAGDSLREYSGTVSSSETTTVSFSVPGTITGLYAKEGQKISKGQLLGKVRNGEYLNAYNIAQAQLEEAQDGYNRLKKLHDANALPDIKWVEIQQKLKQAQNAAEMAKRSLEDADLHSPVAGTVTRKFADVGQTVIPAEPIYEIIAVNDLTVEIPVSENEVGSFAIGEKASVKIDALENSVFEGKVTQKSVTADPLTRSYNIKVAIPNPDGKILPGMIASVTFPHLTSEEKQSSSLSDNIMLPSQAVLLNHDNRWFVWVVKDSIAERRFVTADELVAKGIMITSGLHPGDKVIVEGMQKIGSGSRVVY